MIRLYPLPLCYEGYESKSLNPILTYFALKFKFETSKGVQLTKFCAGERRVCKTVFKQVKPSL